MILSNLIIQNTDCSDLKMNSWARRKQVGWKTQRFHSFFSFFYEVLGNGAIAEYPHRKNLLNISWIQLPEFLQIQFITLQQGVRTFSKRPRVMQPLVHHHRDLWKDAGFSTFRMPFLAVSMPIFADCSAVRLSIFGGFEARLDSNRSGNIMHYNDALVRRRLDVVSQCVGSLMKWSDRCSFASRLTQAGQPPRVLF